MPEYNPEASVQRLKDFCTHMAEIEAPCTPEAIAARGDREAASIAHAEYLRLERLRSIGIPEEFWPHLSEQQDLPAFTHVASLLGSDRRGLILTGNVGQRKTTAACWALSAHGGWFIRAIDLSAVGQYDADFWDRARLASLLVIDEMGKEPADEKGWYEASVYRLLNGRHEDRLKTIVIANVSRADFRRRYMRQAQQAIEAGRGELEAQKQDPLYDRMKKLWLAPEPLVGPSLRSTEVLPHWSEREES